MKIIKILMERCMKYEELFRKHKLREASHFYHITTYMIALAFLGLYDPQLIEKQILWKRFVSAPLSESKKYYKRLLNYKVLEMRIINMAFEKIEKIKDENQYAGGLWKPGSWGVLSYEMEAES